MAGWNPLAARPEVAPKPGAPVPGLAPGQPGAAKSDLKATLTKNRTTLLAAGAAGVVLLALVMKNRSGASSAAEGEGVAGTMTTQPQNLGAYDSSASDIYNALQPQIETLSDLFSTWKTDKDATSTVPVAQDPGVTVPTDSVPVTGLPSWILDNLGSLGSKIGVDTVASKNSGATVYVGDTGNTAVQSATNTPNATTTTIVSAEGKSAAQLAQERAKNIYVSTDPAIAAAYDSAIRIAQAAGR